MRSVIFQIVSDGVVSDVQARVPLPITGGVLYFNPSGDPSIVSVAQAQGYVESAIALNNLQENGSVIGLALGSVPKAVLLTVQSPSGGQVLWATVVGAPTADGFDYQLSAPTDAVTYKLHYLIIL